MNRECLSAAQLSDLLDDGLDSATRRASEEHLNACERCQKTLVEMTAEESVQTHWQELWRTRTISIRGEAAEPDAAFVRNLKESLHRERRQSRSPVLPSIPGYEILGEVGSGGSAIVYRARQLSLNRLVALKVILAGQHLRPDRVARFRAEAEAVARLQHPNIIQIYQVGQAGDLPYLALEWLDGGSLAQRLRTERLTALDSAALIETLARAMHFAHERGIVHRDLKPGNILLQTAEGGRRKADLSLDYSAFRLPSSVFEPKIADFGLAKSFSSDESGLTQSGDVLGTPSYMAPEQARPGSTVGPATDVYALGAMLYELLSGRPPFLAATPLATLSRVLHEEPSRLSSAPRDLETIVFKCLDKNAARRYASAAELADDLGRFQRGEPIRARPVGDWEMFWKWAKRHPAIAGLVAAVALVTLLGLAGVSYAFLQARTAQHNEKQQRQIAEADRERAERSVYLGLISQARSQWLLNNVEGAERLLEQCPPERRGWEWRYLDRLNHADRLTIPGNAGPFANSIAYGRDRRSLFVAGGNPFAGHSSGYLRAYDLQGQLLWDVGPFAQPVWSVAVSPDGQLIASASGTWAGPDSGEVVVRDAATGRVRFKVPGLESHSARGVAFDATGTRLAFTLTDRTLRVWDIQAERELYRLEHDNQVESAAFSADGRILAAGAHDGTHLWDTATRKRLVKLPQSGSRIALHPDGHHLAAASDATVRVWNIRDPGRPALVQVFAGHDGPIASLAYSADGRRLATAGVDSTVRVWDAENGREFAVYRGHRGRAAAVAFHPDGRELASAGQQPGEVKVWDLTQPQEYTMAINTAGEKLDLLTIGFGEDNSLNALTINGSLHRWTPAAGSRPDPHEYPLRNEWLVPSTTGAMSGDGLWLAGVPKDETRLDVWNLVSGEHIQSLPGHTLKIWHVAIDRTGQRIASAAFGLKNGEWIRGIKVWDRSTGATAFSEAAPNRRTTALALSPDGGWLAEGFVTAKVRDDRTLDWAGAAPAIRLIPLNGQAAEAAQPWPPENGSITALAFDAASAKLAAAGDDGTIRLWHTATGQPLHERPIEGLISIAGLAFHPDGSRLAGVNRERLQVWDVVSGQSILTLRGAEQRPNDNGFNPRIAWSPDGRKLAASQWNRTVSVWTADLSK